ncbi:MAG: hypothetical protein ACP5T4_02595 [Candidatus Micrarchaeia archaeon]
MLFLFSFSFSAVINAQTANESLANATLAKAKAYVQLINESGFLVFYPNLSPSYAYLTKAEKVLNKSPSESIAYADLAVDEAKKSYENLNKYRVWSFIIMVLLTIAIGILLFALMGKPAKRPKNKKS